MSEGLTIRQTMHFDDISRREVYRRLESGELRRVIGEDGQPTDLIDPFYLTADGKKRYRDSKLAELVNSKPSESTPAASGQGNFFPILDADREAAARIPSQPEREVAFRRKRIVDLCLNHNWKAEGYDSKGDYQKALAERNDTSVRSIQRWVTIWKKSERREDLVKDRPGPERGTGTALDADMRSHLYTCYQQGLTPRQCARSLDDYLKGKQDSPGCRVDHVYHFPSLATSERYVRSLDALDDAMRQGPDAVKAACGHLDRSYLDLAPLECVENDECKLNLFAYDPRHPANRRGEPWDRRFWLLTFYDARSMYPLTWTLCEGNEYELRRGITVEDEINLFVRLVREFGVPESIHSDRGRFRGREWGGEPYQQRIDKEFAPVNGILQRLGQLAGLPEGIRHDMPRVHNPRGTRLERFHRFLADWFRGKPGWIGANHKERKMTHGDRDRERYRLWCAGKLAPGERAPLLTRDEVLAEVNAMMEAWRDHNSEGTDMHGLTPRAVFVQNSPRNGFRRISDDDLAFATAEHFQNEHIAQGGIIELRDGSRYSHPLLIGLAGQKREVVRLRHNHDFITVLPAQKGEETIRANRRGRMGMNDPDELARQMEMQNRLNKLAGAFTKPREYEPGAQMPVAQEPPSAPAAFQAEPEGPPPNGDNEVSAAAYFMEHQRPEKPPKGRGLAYLED